MHNVYLLDYILEKKERKKAKTDEASVAKCTHGMQKFLCQRSNLHHSYITINRATAVTMPDL